MGHIFEKWDTSIFHEYKAVGKMDVSHFSENGRVPFLLIILIILATFAVYYDSFNNSFVWDDFSFVVNNKAIRCLDPKKIISFFTDRDTASDNTLLSADVYRPLVTASFALDYKLWGLNPHMYHIENTTLHLINVFLVYILADLILK